MRLGFLEKMLVICPGWLRLHGFGAALAGLEPRQHVSCRRFVLSAAGAAEPDAAQASPAPARAGWCRDHHHGGIRSRTSDQPGLCRLGLSGAAFELPRTDLLQLLSFMDPRCPGRNDSIRHFGQKNTVGQITDGIFFLNYSSALLLSNRLMMMPKTRAHAVVEI